MQKIQKKYTGVIIPMVTPVNEKFQIDVTAVNNIINSFVKTGVEPFLLGTTGESFSVSDKQKDILVKESVKALKGRTRIYAGISANCYEESVECGKKYTDFGVDALVAHLPFYYPIDPEQMIRYFEDLANAVKCPLILYNNPITTKHSIPVEVIEKLSYHPNIYGIKDSERGMDRLNESLRLWKDRADFVHLTGWAAQSAYGLLNGSDGIIPSTGNVTPDVYKNLYDAAIAGDASKANELQDLANRISEVYQKDRHLSQSLPALKVMMASKGLCQEYVLPPMYSLSKEEVEKIRKATKEIL
jgi:dihydrodipicolinate synthase/N-acetylneuraminate lyase